MSGYFMELSDGAALATPQGIGATNADPQGIGRVHHQRYTVTYNAMPTSPNSTLPFHREEQGLRRPAFLSYDRVCDLQTTSILATR